MRLLFLVFIFLGCVRESHRKVRVSDIGWTFSLPNDISLKHSAFDKNGNIKNEAWEESNYTHPEHRVLLLSIQPTRNDYFNSIVFIDSSNQQDWEGSEVTNSRSYIALIDSIPHYEILDTAITTEDIAGVNFQKEYFKAFDTRKNITMKSYKYSRRYKNYSIHYNIRFVDTAIGKKFLQILKTSRFGK